VDLLNCLFVESLIDILACKHQITKSKRQINHGEATPLAQISIINDQNLLDGSMEMVRL
jgi:hypothetical protein